MKKITLFLMASAISFGAVANPIWTGQKLLKNLRSTDVMHASLAYGFVVGVANRDTNLSGCERLDFTNRELVSRVESFLEENPTTMGDRADVAVSQVLLLAWPCLESSPAVDRGDFF